MRLALFLLAGVSLFAQPTPTSQRPARSAPEWVRRATIYQIWPRSFTPEATLAAATAKLPHVAGLGATVVYLGPVQKMSAVGGFTNPYRISNYGEVDPQYGSEADLKAFVTEAHRLGLKVLMDVVFYHTGPDNVLMQDPSNYLRTPDGRIQKGTWQLPRLDFSNARLREALIANLNHWVRDIGVDGFRCDVAAGIPLDFWEQARAAVDKIRPDLFWLAESDLPEEQLQAFDASYNFPWYDTLTAVLRDGAPATRIHEQWAAMRAKFPQDARLLHLSDNHDRDRADVVFGQKGALATAVLNFTLDGLPFVYNGQEIGDRTPTSHNRKTPIQWESLRGAPHLALYRRLFELRKTEPALWGGDVVWIANSHPDSVVSFVRRLGGDEIVSVVNLSNRRLEVTVALPVADWPMEDLLAKKRMGFSLAPGRLVYTLGAFEFAVGKRLKTEPMARLQRPVHTYSIVARDAKTGQMGVAVQSHWFSVGAIVPWAEAGVGAIATQSFVDPSYGKLGLEMLRTGKSAPETLRALLAGDDGSAVRQVAIVDAQGRVAAHTGEKNIEKAGHITGDGFSVQANMMLNDTVWPAMARAFSTTQGDLAERMLAALAAAQAAGGDIRGRQSAALIVVNAKSTGKPWVDRVFDLRIDDHTDPISELRRLVTLQRAYNHMNAGDLAVEAGDNPRALTEYRAAASLVPGNLEMDFWHAVALVNMKRVDDAMPLFQRVFAADPNWKELTRRLPKAGLLPGDPTVLQKILN